VYSLDPHRYEPYAIFDASNETRTPVGGCERQPDVAYVPAVGIAPPIVVPSPLNR